MSFRYFNIPVVISKINSPQKEIKMFTTRILLVVVMVVVMATLANQCHGQRHPERSLSCKKMMIDKPGLPCVEVPRCSYTSNAPLVQNEGAAEWIMENSASVHITESSTGSGKGQSVTAVNLCFDDTNLYLNADLKNQFYLTNEQQFQNCNDHVYNENVFEMFIVPDMEEEPHCYNELDVSPNNVMFEAGIYNPNLNQTGVIDANMSCDTSGIVHHTNVVNAADGSNKGEWKAALSYPFQLLNCPYNCQSMANTTRYCGHNTPNDIYRANFFRVNELTPVSKCSSSTCEYLAWNPTMANPPAFHLPTYFGYILLQFDQPLTIN